MSPSDHDVDAFLDSVSEVSRLIDGLKTGTVSPEYIDTKIAQREDSVKTKQAGNSVHGVLPAAKPAVQQDAPATEAAKQAELLKKVEELKLNRKRKLKARQLYEGHVQGKRQHQHAYATDYTQWELWCPSDEEDDMFNSLTPNSPEFRAMEKEISTRHARMVEQQQIAERQRQLGNAAFKTGQYSEALRCYEVGLETQRHNMTLHANAAVAALKLRCYVAAQEHCDKVLHLAEVLHDTPKHPLCVKALQRRAAAHQGLGQHSKAVSDLQAAADMLPGDAEVEEQLQRAHKLLEEHRMAKQLVRLVEPEPQQQRDSMLGRVKPDSGVQCHPNPSSLAIDCDGTTAPMDRPATASSKECSDVDGKTNSQDHIVAQLQHIKQLTSSLEEVISTAGGGKQGQRAAQICQELKGLVQGDCHTIFFRSCGGLDMASKLVVKVAHHEAQAAGLQLLGAVCDCDTALEQLSDQVLGASLDLISCQQPAVALAALDLAYAAASCGSVRPKLGAQLLKRAQQQQQGQEHSGRLVALWGVCCGPPLVNSLKPATKQVVTASLLSNCMLVPAVRTAMVAHLQQAPHTLTDLAEMLKKCTPGAATKVYGLLSNMCNHAGLRAEVACCQLLLQQMLQEACKVTAQHLPHAGPTELQLAVLGCMCNLSLEPAVQQGLCANEGLIKQLLQSAVHGAAEAVSSITCSSSSMASSSSLAAPQLPPRAKDRRSTATTPKPPAVPTEDACCLACRAAIVLSRAAKQPPGAQLLQQNGALGLLAGAIPPVLDVLLSAYKPQQEQQPLMLCQPQTQLDGVADAAGDWVAAAVRILAMLTAPPDACSGCSPDDATTVIDACCRLLRSTAVQDTVRGNAALVLKGFTADSRHQWHRQLTQADAVEALITAARCGKGGPSSRNAGITLALLARAGGVFIERMRELRGLEVLHAYVRPA